MDAAFRYLKWNDDVVGLVVPDLSVRFAEPRFNTTVGNVQSLAHFHSSIA